MKSTTLLMGSLVAASQYIGALALSPSKMNMEVPSRVIRQAKPSQTPVEDNPVPGSLTSQGCFSSRGNFTVMEDVTPSKVSKGYCENKCKEEDYSVMGMTGSECLCGFKYPEKDSLTKDGNCDYPCPAYPYEACGGLDGPGYVTVFNLGSDVRPGYYEKEKEKEEEEEDDDKKDDEKDNKSDKETTTAPAPGPTNTSPSNAPEESAAESSAPAEDDKKGDDDGVNVAGIVAGCVAGVVAIAAGAGVAWFFMRRRRNTELEEEHRRNAAVNAFISGSKPPGSSGSISITDSRLDPVLAHRRLSDGSIADNEDYSRKILRVTNA